MPKIDLKKKYTTKTGEEVILWEIDGSMVFGRFIDESQEDWVVGIWDVHTGKTTLRGESSDYDLVEKCPDMWVNMYINCHNVCEGKADLYSCGISYETKEEAVKNIINGLTYKGTYKLVKE